MGFPKFRGPQQYRYGAACREIHHFPRDESRLSSFEVDGKSLADVFEANAADALVVIHGDTLVHESYWNGMDAHRQHIWYSMTKSLVSSIAGLLVERGNLMLRRALQTTFLNSREVPLTASLYSRYWTTRAGLRLKKITSIQK